MRSNCLAYALWKWVTKGGSIIIRRSQLAEMFPRPRWHPVNWLPHFLHRARCLEITQFVPTEATKERHKALGLWRAWFDLWSFDGEVIGDDKPRQPCPCDECEGIDPVAASNHLEER